MGSDEQRPVGPRGSRWLIWLKRLQHVGESVWTFFGLLLLLGGGGLVLFMLLFGLPRDGTHPQPPPDPSRDWGKDVDRRILRDAEQASERESRQREFQQEQMKKLEEQRKSAVIRQRPSGLTRRTYDPATGKYDDEP